MIAELFLGVHRTVVGVIQFDCTPSATHTDPAEITVHPIEDEEDITDHIHSLPPTLDLNGIVSNTPLAILASQTAASPLTTDVGPVDDRVEAAYTALLKAKEEGTIMDVETSLRSYENMAIENLAVTRDQLNGNVLNCNLSLKKVTIATTLTEPLPLEKAKKKAKDKGKKQKDGASDSQSTKAKSLLTKLGL